MPNSIGENIRNFRKLKDWSQENFGGAVADLLRNKERSFTKSVSQWESGVIPPMETVIAIARLMGVTLDELCHKEIETYKSICEQNETVSKIFEQLTDQETIFLYDILHDLDIHKYDGEDGFYEVILCPIFLDIKKVDEILELHEVSMKGLSQFEKKIIKTNEATVQIDTWLRSIVFKRFIKLNIFSLENVCETIDENNVETYAAIVEIYLTEIEIKELFAKRAIISAEEIIVQAKMRM